MELCALKNNTAAHSFSMLTLSGCISIGVSLMGTGEMLKVPQVCAQRPSTNISGLIQATVRSGSGLLCICLPLIVPASTGLAEAGEGYSQLHPSHLFCIHRFIMVFFWLILSSALVFIMINVCICFVCCVYSSRNAAIPLMVFLKVF